MSILKQIVGVLLVMGVVAAGFYTYDRYAGEAAVGPGEQRGPQAVPVRLAQVESGRTARRVEAVGSTMARSAIQVVPLASGRVQEILFEPGERVEAGAPLAHLDDDIEQANLAEAQAALREAELALERARTLRQSNTVTQATLEQLISQEAGARAALNRAERRLQDRVVRAPFAGVVGLRRVDVGARVDDSTVLTTLDDLSDVEIEFSLPETLYGGVRQGQPVVATSAAFPGRRFDGVVATIDSRIDQTSRAFKVRARLPNRDLVLPAGMFMLLTVILDERDAVTVPEEAIVAEGNSTYLFVVEGDRAIRRDIRLGQREVGAVEILEGVRPGEAVVIEGQPRLRDGATVRVVGEVQPPVADEDMDADGGPA